MNYVVHPGDEVLMAHDGGPESITLPKPRELSIYNQNPDGKVIVKDSYGNVIAELDPYCTITLKAEWTITTPTIDGSQKKVKQL